MRRIGGAERWRPPATVTLGAPRSPAKAGAPRPSDSLPTEESRGPLKQYTQ